MNPSQETSGVEEPFVPFTKGERMLQLSDIDKSIVSLLPTVAQALQSISKNDSTTETDTRMAAGDDDDSKDVTVFKESMDQFVRTLRSVDVRIKRQVMGMEEEGIVNLGSNRDGGESKSKSLQPDGHGRVGGVDAGWLNSRSNKVERDMEQEIWAEVESLTAQLVEGMGGVKSEGEEDTQMTS
ncbi:mediator complex protein [Apiospora saccharicola]|uniref:Mediator of RNA polymerase II transcription subunit 11 n=1 Tax=Apiospora saccharicola TaxID=335842 RepID=A0ABR1UWI5_9PEZI